MVDAVTRKKGGTLNAKDHVNAVELAAQHRQEDDDSETKALRISFRSSHSEVFLGKGVLKICNKFTGEHPCRSVISIKMQSNFIEITFRYRCSPVHLLHIFRTSLLKNTSGWLLLKLQE